MLHTLDVVDVVVGIGAARFTAADVVHSCLDRIGAREPLIQAWAHLDGETALRQAHGADAEEKRGGLLAGVPFGVKDVIDTSELPTEMGSQVYRGHHARYDASCVGLARRAGGIVLGKTVSAEFAGTQPTRTANPHDITRTPGGSSSGSAAAVADFMVPFAFGTQTGGSILRPAAFCGIVGFKPTFGLYSPAGMKVAAHSFDTIGLLARSVRDIATIHAVMMSDASPPAELSIPRVGFFPSHLWDTVDDDMKAAVDSVLHKISAARAPVTEIVAPVGFAIITQHRAVINAFERARGLAGEALSHVEDFSPQSREVCERGFAISGERYLEARRATDDFRARAGEIFDGVDVLVTPTTPGEAPEGKSYAGDPRLQELWTMLHLPSITLPAGRGRHGLPLGIELVARAYQDQALLAHASWLSAIVTDR
ncbi:MAG TPA: amidase [Candidatus Binataceae bacterium]|nr:amidase [Candidatus Binataceae bacterium]